MLPQLRINILNFKGFTLIEALLAISLLSIALFGTFTLLHSIMGYNKYAETITTATTLAQDKVEDLKNTDYPDIIAGTTTETDIDEDGNSGTGGIYSRSTTIDDTTFSNMKVITTTVSWNWKGNPKNVSLKTLIKD